MRCLRQYCFLKKKLVFFFLEKKTEVSLKHFVIFDILFNRVKIIEVHTQTIKIHNDFFFHINFVQGLTHISLSEIRLQLDLSENLLIVMCTLNNLVSKICKYVRVKSTLQSFLTSVCLFYDLRKIRQKLIDEIIPLAP